MLDGTSLTSKNIVTKQCLSSWNIMIWKWFFLFSGHLFMHSVKMVSKLKVFFFWTKWLSWLAIILSPNMGSKNDPRLIKHPIITCIFVSLHCGVEAWDWWNLPIRAVIKVLRSWSLRGTSLSLSRKSSNICFIWLFKLSVTSWSLLQWLLAKKVSC